MPAIGISRGGGWAEARHAAESGYRMLVTPETITNGVYALLLMYRKHQDTFRGGQGVAPARAGKVDPFWVTNGATYCSTKLY